MQTTARKSPEPHRPTEDALPIETLGLDEMERGLLAVLRHFLNSFSEPESQSWQMGFAIAAERWGETSGPRRAMALLTVVQAMRRARPVAFRHANPLCPSCRGFVTPEEASLMRMLQAMRRDWTAEARELVAEVTCGRLDSTLIRTGLSLATILPEREEHMAPRVTHRGLALVH